ncbi:MAG: hypothetical protein M3R17_12820 [Bacteroidota bacterium]|nr:hypothetical protein [Bacteroidota bacterium]
MRSFFFLLLFLFTFSSCREPQTAVSCAGGNQSNSGKNAGQADRDPHFFKRRKKIKGQDGFKQQDKKTKRAVKKAEKGKKKQRRETRAERRWHLFRKNREAQNDVAAKEKGNSRKNERKQKKLNKKRKRHPQMGLFPKGGRPG